MTDWNNISIAALASFQATLDNGNVSKAAAAVGLTQSAVSKHLARLRDIYDDPLFVRTSDGMRPTAHALWMSKHIAGILSEAQVLGEARTFDSRTLTGSITIATTDEVRRALLPAMMDLLDDSAPHVRLTFRSLQSDYYLNDLESGQLDLAISVNWHAPDGLKQTRLFVDQFVCLTNAAIEIKNDVLDRERYIALPHILVAPFGMTHGAVDEVLTREGQKRFVRLSVPDFQQITPELLAGRYVVTLPSWVATSLKDRFPGAFREWPVPIDVQEIAYYALWHERFDKDPKSRWLRDSVKGILSALKKA